VIKRDSGKADPADRELVGALLVTINKTGSVSSWNGAFDMANRWASMSPGYLSFLNPLFCGYVLGRYVYKDPFRGCAHTGPPQKKNQQKITSGVGWLAYIAPPWWPGTTQQRTALPLVAFVTYEKGPPFHHHPLGGNSSSQCTGYLCPLVKHHVEGDPSQQQDRKSKSDFVSR
jgi:hypothetical protein